VAGNLANLQKATAARTAGALVRAETALTAMVRAGGPVTFRGLAAHAGVSLDFLYRNTQIRSRVEHLRASQQTCPPAGQPDRANPDQPGSVVRALTIQLTDLKRRHREETAALRQALEAAHGENLLLRRRLGHDDAAASDGQPDQPETSIGH
jgi:Family of unknown function (DUF6262)